MNYKIISMDFDGTLLTSDKNVTDATRKELLKYKNDNYIIIGITARNLASASDVCDIKMFNYLILNNGSYIYDVEKCKVININKIDKNIVIDITNHIKDETEQIDYCSLNKYYIYKNKIKQNKLIKVKEYIEKTFNDIDVIVMSDTDNKNNREWLVLNSKGTNKLETLKVLCKKLDIPIDKVIFFGDSTNDLSIIGQVGIGIAMGNALEEVKKQSKDITLSNDNDGIAYYLEKYKNNL